MASPQAENGFTRIANEISEAIVRIEKGINQYDLSSATNLPQGLISLFETGHRKSTPKQAQKIANALKVRVSDIFSENYGDKP